MANYKLIHLSTEYADLVRTLTAQSTALRALEAGGNVYAGVHAGALEAVVKQLEPMGKLLEDVPTWSDIALTRLREGA